MQEREKESNGKGSIEEYERTMNNTNYGRSVKGRKEHMARENKSKSKRERMNSQKDRTSQTREDK